jgi:DNA-binding NtrC family response regulator
MDAWSVKAAMFVASSVTLRNGHPGPPAGDAGDHGSSIVTDEDRGRSRVEEPRRSLLVLFGSVAERDRSVDVGTETLQIGRVAADRFHLRLDDSRVSRHHAEIAWSSIQRRHWIRDLNSRNGVYVNGAKVARAFLACGDIIRVGNTIFRFGPGSEDLSRLRPIEPPFVGTSRSLRLTIERAFRVATVEASVLILGPTGTGKELVANFIHQASGLSGPLRVVNCAALPSHLVESELFGHEKGAFSGAGSARPGLFRAAHGGTLFLDEVGELSPEIQAKLLRALDTRSIRPVGAAIETSVQVRVVAATNRDLAGEVRAGRFRDDLYARLAELVVQIDPLRERPEDLWPLWRHFLAELGGGATLELSGAAFEAMALHAWPRNVRELRQCVRGALLLESHGGELGVEDLPPEMQPSAPETMTAQDGPITPFMAVASEGDPGARTLHQLLEAFEGNVREVAAFLGKDRRQVYRWLKRHHIDPDVYRKGR